MKTEQTYGASAKSNRLYISAPEIEISRLKVDPLCDSYNIIECDKMTPIRSLVVSNMNLEFSQLTHNIVNAYVFADDAVVKISDCSFDIDPTKTNPLRVSNYQNAKNVTVVFENVNWNYENSENKDYTYAGLLLYQPAKTDDAMNGNLENMKSWKFIFKNCKYNGVKVTENNYEEQNQVFYCYGINSKNENSNPEELGFDISFE